MRKIREVLRLHYDAGLGIRAISRSLKASPSTVREYLVRAKIRGLSWPLPEPLDDAALLRRLYPTPAQSSKRLPPPDWSKVHRELRRKGVTLALLWEEYKTVHPQGMQYSWFCEQYRAWAAKVDVVMRQEHRAGEKLFVDYAGHTVGVVNRDTGEVRQAQVFVAVLGASNYTYAEATWTQTLPDWIASHVRAFQFMGGSTELLIPDNLRSAVSRAHRYEPDTHPTYHDLACHYGVAVLPARVKKPRDKAKVEVAVQVVERWVLAVLRNRTFFSLAELNAAIAKLLERLNHRPFRKLPGSRRELFEQLDRPALRPLPAERYVFAEWKKARVNIDYHVEVERHYYSVPHALVGRQLDVRLTATTVECLYRGQRVASHVRSPLRGRHTTADEHMPEKHRKMGQWSPQRFIRWARTIGPHTATLIEAVLRSRRHPQQAFRSCLGILRLADSYGEQRLEAAAGRAVSLGANSYRSVESILKHRLDERPSEQIELGLAIEHTNLRGPSYYN
ncbi:MAG: IS21 family transposase [Chloroflexota bacterium]|nr:IS21 family transposase [Chloroflexota bacterium]